MLGVAICSMMTNVAHGEIDPVMKRDRYLVLDSRVIDKTNNVELTVGFARKDVNNPLFKEDNPWEPRFDNPYCSIIYDDEEKIYKCWYSVFIRSDGHGDFPGEGLAPEKRAWVNWVEGRRGFGVCYATSKDGLHWNKPELGQLMCLAVADFHFQRNQLLGGCLQPNQKAEGLKMKGFLSLFMELKRPL